MGDRPDRPDQSGDGSSGTELRLAILGPVAGSRGGVPVALGPVRQRAVLTLLVLHTDAGLSRADVVDALWRGDPPGTATTMVHGYIARIRGLLGHGRDGAAAPRPKPALFWDGARYRLAPGAIESDLTDFARLADLAREAADSGDAAQACQRYEQSLRLWRAEPAADIELLQSHPAVIELSQRRAALIVDYAATAEAAGRHEQVLGHLQALAGRAPLDERVHARLMIALAATGQQAAALGVYENLRRRLDDELGMPPGRELAEAHLRVLRQQAAPPAAQRPAPARPPVPRQLPVAPRHFAGRARELHALSRLLSPPGGNPPGVVVIAAIGGTAGIGKTALAVHWAHQIAERFPDGQLYLNLRGFDPSGAPVAPADAIRRFLDALQVPASQIPSTAEAQQDLYRSLLAGRRMLIVLDNARDAEQVRPLLPGGPGCLVLVTSRSQLTSLVAVEGAHPVTLDLLSPADARELLARRLGPARIMAEADGITELTELCARLPLALAIAAARAAQLTSLPLATLVTGLREAGSRLDVLDAGDPAASMRAVFSWSYRHLTQPAARMFRLLGVHPGPDITAPAATSLAGIPLGQARHALATLTRASLLTEHLPGRFAFHDLLRSYAAECAEAEDSEQARLAAIHRALDHYVHTADAAALVLNPHRGAIPVGAPRPGVTPERIADLEQATAWFEAERRVLLAVLSQAADAGFDTHVWQLPLTLATFLNRCGDWHQYRATHQLALAAGQRLGDLEAQAIVHRNLGHASMVRGAYQDASAHHSQALEFYRRLGDRTGQGRAQLGLGSVVARQGRNCDAIAHFARALDLLRSTGDQAWQATALNNIGWCHTELGNYHQALGYCQQALALHQEVGDRASEAADWDSLGYTRHLLGQHAEALTCYQQALALTRELGDRPNQAEVLVHLGETYDAGGEAGAAQEAWQQALAILDDLRHPAAEQVREKAKQARADYPAKVAQSR